MQAWVLKDFAADHPDEPSPVLRHLTHIEAGDLRRTLARLLGSKTGLTSPFLAHAISEDPNFSIKSAIETAIGRPCPRVIVFDSNYWRPCEAREFDLATLDRWFNELWFPGTSDLDITDPEGSFLMQLFHEDALRRLDD